MNERTTYEDVQRLVIKMREGSTEARRELIEAHVGLAFKEAQAYEDDEALSDALVTLVEEVDNFRVSGRHPAALPAYLKVALHNAAHAHCRNDGVSKRGGHLRHSSLNDAKRFIHSGRPAPEYHDQKLTILMDHVLGVCEDDGEREMIFWLSMSLTYAEVASRMRTNYAHVARTVGRLKLRYSVQEKLQGLHKRRVSEYKLEEHSL